MRDSRSAGNGGGGFDNGGSAGQGANFGNGGVGNALGTGESMGPGGPATATVTGTYIWIANSSEGTVSKIDTRTMEELGRYLTTPNGDGNPSRTSVGSTGAVVVANRGGGVGMVGSTGVVKIEADEARCIDRNGNGAIETSTGGTDILPWMQDECLIWFTPLDFYSNRPVSWAPGAGPDAPEVVWTSGTRAGECTAAACTFSVLKLNGETGAIEATIEVGPLSGAPFTFVDILIDYGAYGGAPDAGGNFWGFTANTTHLFRVDGATHEVLTWEIPNANGYGITVDPRGRVFVCGSKGLTRFDPATQSFETNNGGVDIGTNGCMTDGADLIWVGGSGLSSYNAITMEFVESHPVGDVKGVSVDYDGKIWGVSKGTTAYRLDPVDGSVETFDDLVGAYSYSDMTGHGLSNAGYTPVAVE